MHYTIRITSLASILLMAPLANAAPVAKQLAGPPSEFQLMAPAQPAATATHSKSALIPVQLEQNKKGQWSWQSAIPVEESQFRFLVLSGGSSDWEVGLRAPTASRSQSAEGLASEMRTTQFGMAGNNYPADYFAFETLQPGQWSLSITASNPKQKEGFVLINSDGPHRLLSYKTGNNQLMGQSIGFVAHGYSKQDNEAIHVDQRMVNTANLNITAPDGQSWREAMFDDGLHNDGKAGDGIFGGDFLATQAGSYNVQVVAQGHTPDGLPLLRTAEHLVPVIASDLSLSAGYATSATVNDHRLMVNVPVTTLEAAPQYRVFTEVWGASLAGHEMVPVAWIGGMVKAANGNLELGLDARWIALAGAQAPFELRNLRIEDSDHFIPLAKADSLTLYTPQLPQAAFRAVDRIDEEMLMGARPPMDNTRAGSRLLLVHGYCSSDVWGPQLGQFSSASVFQDFNKNRSHDAFAQRILSFGNSYSSYGIVAHSQGGAAATHLYTFYWSGLDNAGSGRLIQSVGTPYQGTSLAGNLAAIGAIFGAGCGSNTDLTYSGAANWLAGIPSWARSAVNYYTTSFTDVWWRWDYCHIASDLVLSDPDDGTTEKAYGQLSGAVNRGHKTGWCHTRDMRDPGQTTDGSRNSTMNANAAR